MLRSRDKNTCNKKITRWNEWIISFENLFDKHNDARILFVCIKTRSNPFQYWFLFLLVLNVNLSCPFFGQCNAKTDTAHFIIARKYGGCLFRKRRKNRFVQSIKDKYKVLFMRSEAKKRVGSLGSVHAYTFWCSLSCENFIWPSRYASNPYVYTCLALPIFSISFYIHYISCYIRCHAVHHGSKLTGPKPREREKLS